MSFENLTGQKFGRLTVVCVARRINYKTYWKCECDCGCVTVVQASNLKSGHTKSCGCYNSEVTTKRNYKHGKRFTPLYNTWNNMRRRCYDEMNAKYYIYGARGITVCDEWEDFETFYDDVSILPNFGKKGFTLHRIDNDGNYEPSNVKWANAKEQANERSSNRLYTYNGKTQTISQWADEYNINYEKLRQRLVYRNWTIEKALTTP